MTTLQVADVTSRVFSGSSLCPVSGVLLEALHERDRPPLDSEGTLQLKIPLRRLAILRQQIEALIDDSMHRAIDQ